MGKNKGKGNDDNNGDSNGQSDVQETGTWFCNTCGKNGSCVKGDEARALTIHQLAEHS